MAKNIELVRQDVAAMRNEVEDFANSAERVGGVVSEVLEYSYGESERAKGVEESLTKMVAQNVGDITGLREAEEMLTQIVNSNFNAISELGVEESAKIDGYEIALTKKTNTAEKTKVKVPVYDMQNPSATPVGLVDEIFVDDMEAEAKKMVDAEAERAEAKEQEIEGKVIELESIKQNQCIYAVTTEGKHPSLANNVLTIPGTSLYGIGIKSALSCESQQIELDNSNWTTIIILYSIQDGVFYQVQSRNYVYSPKDYIFAIIRVDKISFIGARYYSEDGKLMQSFFNKGAVYDMLNSIEDRIDSLDDVKDEVIELESKKQSQYIYVISTELNCPSLENNILSIKSTRLYGVGISSAVTCEAQDIELDNSSWATVVILYSLSNNTFHQIQSRNYVYSPDDYVFAIIRSDKVTYIGSRYYLENGCLIQSFFNRSSMDDRFDGIEERLESIEDEIKDAPCMFNPPIDLRKDNIRILDIGNSYTTDATHYLPRLISSAGIDVSDMCIYKAVRAGGSFKNWCDVYRDLDVKSYVIEKVCGGLSANIEGESDEGNGEMFRNALINNDWDIIIIHQSSTYAPYYNKWEDDADSGGLSDFIRIIRKHQPNATIGFLLVHSYWSGYTGNVEGSSFERWKLIADSAKRLQINYGIDFIIPYGTAIQNLRLSSLNNEYDLTSDGVHCADGLADYTATCTYFQSIFAPRYNVSVLGDTTRIDVEQSGTYPSSAISVTDENAYIAQKSAFIACYNRYKCINPEEVE